MKRKVNRKSVKKNAPMSNDNFRGIDLFEDYENIPPRINAIIERYQDLYGEDLGGMDYKDTARMLEEFEQQGYTFGYGLDNEPYGLRPIGVKLNELKGFEEFGDDEYGGGGKTKKDKDAKYWLDVIYNDEVYGLIDNFLDIYEKSYAGYLIDGDLSTDTNDIKDYAENVKKSFIQLMKVDGDLRKLNDKLYGILDSLNGYVGESQKSEENRIKRTIPKLEDVYIQILDKLQFAEDSIYYGMKGKIFNEEFEDVEEFKEYVSEIIEVVKIKIHYINNYQEIMGMARNGMKVNRKSVKSKPTFGSLYSRIVEAVEKEVNVSYAEAVEIVDNRETMIIDMIEYSEITSPKVIADIITSDYGEEYGGGGETPMARKGMEVEKKYGIVKDLRTLNAIAKKYDLSFDNRFKYYTGNAYEDNKGENLPSYFQLGERVFILKYFDGSFHPFLYELNPKSMVYRKDNDEPAFRNYPNPQWDKDKYYTKFSEGGETQMARNGMEVKNWSASDVSNAKYLGILEFEDTQGELHNFEVMETEDRLVFGGMTNSGFIESGYIEKDGRSTNETLDNLVADLDVYYTEGVEYTSEIVVNQRMANGGTFGGGGSIAEGNYHMILSQAKEVQHHVSELQDILKKEDDIEAWVVAKMQDVSSTLSDVTHYLDGKSEMPMAKRGMKVANDELPTYDIHLDYVNKSDNDFYYDSMEEIGEFVNSVATEKEIDRYEEMGYDFDHIFGMEMSTKNEGVIFIPRNEKFRNKIVEFIKGKYGNKIRVTSKETTDINLNAKAKRGMKVGEIKYPTITLKEYDLNDDQTEIYAYIETRQELQSQYDTIRKNLMTKIARGEFDETKAPKLFMYLVENGLKLYSKNFGEISLSKQEKEEIANNMVVEFMSEAELGNYENETFLPKKYLAENGMVVMTYDIYDENGECVGYGMMGQDVVDYANLLWYYDMMDEDLEEIDDFDVAKDYLEQDGFNIESHNPEKSSSATKKRKIIRKMKK